jgi:hypothetical protein
MTGARHSWRAVWLAVGMLTLPLTTEARQEAAAVPLPERARNAERVVVGRVVSVNPVWRENDFGDRLIVSVVGVGVDETLKGQAEPSLDVEIEGGTIGTMTLKVSDLPTFAPGDRAVFYLKRNRRGAFVPHLRGQGLLKLDRSDRVGGSTLTLDEVRRTTRPAGPGRTPRQ